MKSSVEKRRYSCMGAAFKSFGVYHVGEGTRLFRTTAKSRAKI